MRRKFVRRRSGGVRPTRVWASVSTDAAFAAVTATTAVPLISLQAPSSLASLTADPPEDMTILRVTGELNVSVAGDATANWTLALLVQDTTWTPATLFHTDADKRILWHQSVAATNATNDTWRMGGTYTVGGTTFPCTPYPWKFDIAPKVKVEAGRALYLVAYENVSGGSLTLSTTDLRVLFQRTGRR